ncbi:MAG: efflux RND transporter periplasmic adaptor subunit, partial [Rickettsiales bacterium]|nr:efflux RND transporter periplasmic adaptor subunit [Rickettsiales bacterium]
MMQTPPSPMPYSPRTKRPFFARRGVQIVLVLLLAVGGWQWLGHRGPSKPTGPAAVNVRVAPVVKQSVPLTLQAVGNVVPYESVAIRARLDSQVTAVHFKDGDEVKMGDPLFDLDDKSLRAQAAQLEANIARDRAQLENARRQSGRAEALVAKGFATKAARDDSAANVAVTQASLNASIAALDSIKVQLGYTRITAPITGRTGTINVTLGNNVKANDPQPLVTINQLKPIRVQAALPQQHFDAVRLAMQTGAVTVTAARQDDAASNSIASGTLDYLDNTIDQSTGTFVTRAGFANDEERLLPGMFVTVAMSLGGDSMALTVPDVAVQRGQNGDYVYVIAGDKALQRPVKIARLQNNVAVITSGLDEA